jgi:phosphopantothenate-cysteine ligase
MPEHKIQSSDGGLVLELDPVPKRLQQLTHDWSPDAFVVSFKLETDLNILIYKAKRAISNYQVNLVVANLLQVF